MENVVAVAFGGFGMRFSPGWRWMMRAGLAVVPVLTVLPQSVIAQTCARLEQHAALAQRMGNLELWMARMDERLAEAHVPPAVPPAGVDRWQLVLFGFLVGTLVVGVGVSAILSW